MRRFLRDNALTLFFAGLCVATIVGDALAGHRVFNHEAVQHDEPTISFWRYLVSAHFGEAMTENWQSEFFQFTAFILATIWLFQRGSVESKQEQDLGLGDERDAKIGRHAPSGAPRWARVGGWRTQLYSHSLVIVMTFFFLLSWLAQSITNWKLYNNEQLAHDQSTLGYLPFLRTADFWERTFQNWQSEFMALATMAIFSVFLRQRGSPESHAVGDPHEATSRSN